jgi:putative tricarboxylic transport membrane protein
MVSVQHAPDGRKREPSVPGRLIVDRRTVLAAGLAGLASAGRAWAEVPFPSRPLTIMAPANPGGGTDQIARLMQSAIAVGKLSPRPMEVINRGGAAGAIGLADLVSRHHGDPHIIMASGSSVISSTVTQNTALRLTDAEPLARLIVDHLIVATPKSSRFATIDELLATFRKNPGAVTWCGGSAGGVDHILVGLIAEACGVPIANVRYIAYAGGGAASAALLGGQVTAGVTGYSEWRNLAQEGRLRVLAAASPERFGDRQIPTLREAGLDVLFHQWRGVFLPPGLKAEHIAWWESLIERMHASEIWRQYITRSGWEDGYLAHDEFRRLVHTDQDRYVQTLARLHIVRAAGGSSPIGPYAVPTAIGVVGIAALGATAVEHLRAPDKPIAAAASEDDEEGGDPPRIWNRLFLGLALSLTYIGALSVIGFLIATPLFLVALGLLMRSERPFRDAIAGVGLTVGIWLMFTRLLYVSLP